LKNNKRKYVILESRQGVDKRRENGVLTKKEVGSPGRGAGVISNQALR
jgi:hypothetical protein